MDEAVEPPEGVGVGQPLVYSSPAIHERRRRILKETRKLIAENGLDGFSMEEVGRRAGVAKRTLYNAYQTRERMIASAIHEYFRRYVGQIQFASAPGTMRRNVQRIVAVSRRNRQIRNYNAAIMAIYFSASASADIWETMHGMAVEHHLEWIDGYRARGWLHGWIDPRALADDIVRLEYAIIHDWCRDKIGADAIALHLVRAVLTLALGASRGGGRREIEDILDLIASDGIAMLAGTT